MEVGLSRSDALGHDWYQSPQWDHFFAECRSRTRHEIHSLPGVYRLQSARGYLILELITIYFQHSESNTSLVTMDPGSTGNENATCPGIDGEVYTYSANDTCFMAKHCEEYQFDSFINYAIFYYCGNCSVGALCVIFFFIPMSVSIFYLLSMASEDFFCPVLSDISLHLNLSPEIAGITILAFGNGSADVFSTIAAIHEVFCCILFLNF